jgi:hypothetical protein
MQRSASARARGVMTRPTVHRAIGAVRDNIGISFNGFLGIVLCTPPPSQPTDWPGSSRSYGRSFARCFGSIALLL